MSVHLYVCWCFHVHDLGRVSVCVACLHACRLRVGVCDRVGACVRAFVRVFVLVRLSSCLCPSASARICLLVCPSFFYFLPPFLKFFFPILPPPRLLPVLGPLERYM